MREFDQRRRQNTRAVIWMFAGAAIINLAILGFVGWVVVKLLAHFGVI